MIPSRRIGARRQALLKGRAPELAGPDDQRVIQQAASLQIGQQSGHRLVDPLRAFAHPCFYFVVMVPAAISHLDEPDSSLGKPPRQQTFAAEIIARFLTDTVKILRRLGLFAQVKNLWGGNLHPESQFIGLNETFDIAIFARIPDIHAIPGLHQIQMLTLQVSGEAGIVEVADHRVFDRRVRISNPRPLVNCWQKDVGVM